MKQKSRLKFLAFYGRSWRANKPIIFLGLMINSLFFNQIPIIWSISTFAIEYQHLINLHLFCSNFNILIDLTFCTQISTFWSIPTLLHSSVNFLIDSPLFTQNTTFWKDLVISTQIWSFWLIPNFVLNFNILINSLFFNQIPTFWLIHTLAIKYQHLIDIKFSLIFQHFDRFDILH